MARATRLEIRNERTRQYIEQLNQGMESWTMEQMNELNTTHHTRQVAEQAYRKVVLGRRYLMLPKHTKEEQFFLRLLVLYALALRPGLTNRAYEVADYYASNYPYEWTQSQITRSAVAAARDRILSSAESEFGETPMAGPLGFVYHHHRTLKIRNISNYGECYSKAVNLVRQRYFMNEEQAWREKLGLHRLHD